MVWLWLWRGPGPGSFPAVLPGDSHQKPTLGLARLSHLASVTSIISVNISAPAPPAHRQSQSPVTLAVPRAAQYSAAVKCKGAVPWALGAGEEGANPDISRRTVAHRPCRDCSLLPPTPPSPAPDPAPHNDRCPAQCPGALALSALATHPKHYSTFPSIQSTPSALYTPAGWWIITGRMGWWISRDRHISGRMLVVKRGVGMGRRGRGPGGAARGPHLCPLEDHTHNSL